MPKTPEYESKTQKRPDIMSGKPRTPISRGQKVVSRSGLEQKGFGGSQLWKSVMLAFYVGELLELSGSLTV